MPDLAWVGAGAKARDRLVVARRPRRPQLDPWRHQGLAVEDERRADGNVARTATVFLTGRECPWRCVMCDLWQHTVDADTPPGAIPAQVAEARATLARDHPDVSVLKLYNAGSFFDPRAVPDADYGDIAAHLDGFDRVVVECHPALVGRRLARFLTLLGTGSRPPHLEVAMGLETAHPEALDALNKRMTVAQFSAAAGLLRDRNVALRVFLLISPPFVPPGEQDAWLLRSVDVALACGASIVSLVPTRPGNGILDDLAGEGSFSPPELGDIERSLESALRHASGRERVVVDTWDLTRFSRCDACLDRRRARLHTMNLQQRVPPPVTCGQCAPSRA
jgi:archaeosine synthase beta-subunit